MRKEIFLELETNPRALYREFNYKLKRDTIQPQIMKIENYDDFGLEIVDSSSTQERRPGFTTQFVAEPFVQSKPIFCEKDGQNHDGCMRYVVFVEEDKKGKIKPYHFGGYWRLAPNPITESLDLDAMRANLAQGAIAQKVSDSDLNIVERALNRNIPLIYRNLVDRINPDLALQRLEEMVRRLPYEI